MKSMAQKATIALFFLSMTAFSISSTTWAASRPSLGPEGVNGASRECFISSVTYSSSPSNLYDLFGS